MQEAKLLEKLGKQGNALTEKRKSAALKWARALKPNLMILRWLPPNSVWISKPSPTPTAHPLPMEPASPSTKTDSTAWNFSWLPTPAKGLKPLAKIASGGETSRLMLGLKNVMARADEVPSLIFDEIDQGIGGRVGMVVGQKLWNLSRTHQVFCVTHLPQLAVFGDLALSSAKTC
jgi:DNA repair protein RecN (Recombination protein N)